MKKICAFVVGIVVVCFNAFSQTPAGIIAGQITTADGKPAEGVTVLVRNLNRNTIADNNGKYKITNIQPGTYTLVVSLVSHKDVEQQVEVENGKTSTIDIKLELSNKELNEVVVIANKNSFKTNRISSSLRLANPHTGNTAEYTGSNSKADQ